MRWPRHTTTPPNEATCACSTGLAPDTPGEIRHQGLGLGVGPRPNATSPSYAAGERATQRSAPRYCPGSRQARRATVPGIDARRGFGVGAQRPRSGGKSLSQAWQVKPGAAHRSPGRGTRTDPEGVRCVDESSIPQNVRSYLSGSPAFLLA